MLNQQRGAISVIRRLAMGAGGTEPPAGDDANYDFPVGQSLLDAVEPLLEHMALSTAIKHYATEAGVDLKDVLGTYLEGQDVGRTTVKHFLTNTGLRPLFSPVVEDGLRLGLNRISARWEGLVAKTVFVDTLTYEYYEFSNGAAGAASRSANPGTPEGNEEFGLRRIGQGAPIPVARVSVSGKSYALTKVGRGIEWTDESKAAPIDLASMWFQQVGLQLGWDYHDEIVDRLLNGFFPDGSDAAPVLATNTANIVTDADLIEAQGVLEMQFGYTANVMLMSLARSVQVRTMENGAGQRLFPNGVEAAGLPPIQIAQTVPDDKIVFVDTGFAILRLVAKEFGTEFSRDVPTQVEGVYGTSIELSVPFMPNARLILDA